MQSVEGNDVALNSKRLKKLFDNGDFMVVLSTSHWAITIPFAEGRQKADEPENHLVAERP